MTANKRTILCLPAAAALAALAGCIIVAERPGSGGDPGARDVRYYDGWDEPEVRYVVYREHFSCSEPEVWTLRYYERAYRLDPDDLFFVVFVSRRARVSIDVAFWTWWDTCRRDHHRLVQFYRLDPAVFFVHVSPHVSCPPPYGRAYGYWRNRTLGGATLTVEEYRALVVMRIGCEYYGHKPDRFFQRCRESGKPSKVIYVDYRSAGIGGRDCEGGRAPKHVRPWEMSPQQVSAWRVECKEKDSRAEVEHKRRGPPERRPERPEPRDPKEHPGRDRGPDEPRRRGDEPESPERRKEHPDRGKGHEKEEPDEAPPKEQGGDDDAKKEPPKEHPGREKGHDKEPDGGKGDDKEEEPGKPKGDDKSKGKGKGKDE